MSLKIGIVGATGMVGEAFMSVLESHKTPIAELRPFASQASAGKKLKCQDREWTIRALEDSCFDGLDVVFFSSGDDISKEWAPKAVESGAFAIDNSAAFRMHPRIPLVVPEVNGHLIPESTDPILIANPNCSTIQLVVVLNALRNFKPVSVRVATYQSVSGAGKVGVEELVNQTRMVMDSDNQDLSNLKPQTFSHPIAFNCVPHIGSFDSSGFCSEEVKIMRETKKILEMPHLKVSAFTVRVPSLNAHSEAVWVTFDRQPSKEEVFAALSNAEGLKFINQDRPEDFPTAHTASGEEPVYVGRVHQDAEDPKTWLLWIVADNILKGAALNGLQIAEDIFDLR